MMYPFLVISDSFSSTSSIKREARALPDYLRYRIEQNQIFVQKRGGAYRRVPDSNVCNDRIVNEKISRAYLAKISEHYFDDMTKGVVDVEKELVAIDAELYADLETPLLENDSRQEQLWGINLYPDENREDFIEFDSLVNIRPRQNNRGHGTQPL